MSNKSDKAFIIFSGYNNRAVLSICRTCTQMKINYFVIAHRELDDLSKTQYKTKIVDYLNIPSLDAQEIKNILTKIKTTYHISKLIILPTAEYLNRFLLDNREELEHQNLCLIPLVNQNTYLSISNKKDFSNICKKYDINIPNEFTFSKAKIPFVAKPKQEFTDHNKRIYPYLISNSKDLENFKNLEKPEDYFYQEYIEGESFYLLFYFYNNGNYQVCLQQNGAQQPNGKSIFFAWSCPFKKFLFVENFITLFKNEKFHGLVMVELKGIADKYYMIEANPRIWGPTQLMLNSHFNLLKCYTEEYFEYKLSEAEFNSKNNALYFWFGGLVEAVLNEKPINWFASGKKMFFKNLPRLLFNDIYLQPDSFKVFFGEIFQLLKKNK